VAWGKATCLHRVHSISTWVPASCCCTRSPASYITSGGWQPGWPGDCVKHDHCASLCSTDWVQARVWARPGLLPQRHHHSPAVRGRKVSSRLPDPAPEEHRWGAGSHYDHRRTTAYKWQCQVGAGLTPVRGASSGVPASLSLAPSSTQPRGTVTSAATAGTAPGMLEDAVCKRAPGLMAHVRRRLRSGQAQLVSWDWVPSSFEHAARVNANANAGAKVVTEDGSMPGDAQTGTAAPDGTSTQQHNQQLEQQSQEEVTVQAMAALMAEGPPQRPEHVCQPHAAYLSQGSLPGSRGWW
jgi:hypothetical protein